MFLSYRKEESYVAEGEGWGVKDGEGSFLGGFPGRGQVPEPHVVAELWERMSGVIVEEDAEDIWV